MSQDSLAMFRKSMGNEMNALAEEHLKHDLRQSDRDALQSAARTVQFHASVGTLVGLSLGAFLAYRLRANRTAMFNAFKAHEQPTAIKFAGGREEPIPDLTKIMKPSRAGDLFTYTLLGFGGIFFGGEIGFVSGAFRARRSIGTDRESRERIETAFRRFQADALRKQADALDDRKVPALGF